MTKGRKLGPLCVSALALSLALGWSVVGSAASTIVSARNSSDPRARVFDGKLYLYTSSDLNQGGNWPMSDTYCYSLSDSSADPGQAANWTDNGSVLNESDYAWSMGQNHLWAPDAFQGADGNIYLYVPDTCDSSGGSCIGASVSSAPEGPFAPPSGKTSSTNYVERVTSYMSDPSVFADPNDPNGQRYLVYADGDYNSASFGCGHVSIAKLDPATTTITGNQQVQWTNQGSIPSAGGCTPAYIEGPELGYFGGAGTDGDGKYFLYFAIKDNTGYTESIGYATADVPMGPYTYQGLIMSGSGGSGWTNQASIVVWQDHYLFFYHNDVSGMANPNRQVYLECVGIQGGKINAVTRGSYTTLDACPVADTGAAGAGGASSGGAGGAEAGGSGGSEMGGDAALGGSNAGGAEAGGNPSLGGSNAGGAEAGGNPSLGGSSDGGASAGGGVVSQGGSNGGAATGGSVSLGGSTVSVGGSAVSVGGSAVSLGGSNGGAATGSGGASAGATATVDNTSSDGCGCRVASNRARAPARALGVLALGLLALASRRRCRQTRARKSCSGHQTRD